MKTPKTINNLFYEANCSSISQYKWQEWMKDTTKANGSLIKKHIKEHLPELYNMLGLQFHNPFEHMSVKKKGLLVYVHSGTEYFFKYN
jgi:hypothetical protein